MENAFPLSICPRTHVSLSNSPSEVVAQRVREGKLLRSKRVEYLPLLSSPGSIDWLVKWSS